MPDECTGERNHNLCHAHAIPPYQCNTRRLQRMRLEEHKRKAEEASLVSREWAEEKRANESHRVLLQQRMEVEREREVRRLEQEARRLEQEAARRLEQEARRRILEPSNGDRLTLERKILEEPGLGPRGQNKVSVRSLSKWAHLLSGLTISPRMQTALKSFESLDTSHLCLSLKPAEIAARVSAMSELVADIYCYSEGRADCPGGPIIAYPNTHYTQNTADARGLHQAAGAEFIVFLDSSRKYGGNWKTDIFRHWAHIADPIKITKPVFDELGCAHWDWRFSTSWSGSGGDFVKFLALIMEAEPRAIFNSNAVHVSGKNGINELWDAARSYLIPNLIIVALLIASRTKTANGSTGPLGYGQFPPLDFIQDLYKEIANPEGITRSLILFHMQTKLLAESLTGDPGPLAIPQGVVAETGLSMGFQSYVTALYSFFAHRERNTVVLPSLEQHVRAMFLAGAIHGGDAVGGGDGYEQDVHKYFREVRELQLVKEIKWLDSYRNAVVGVVKFSAIAARLHAGDGGDMKNSQDGESDSDRSTVDSDSRPDV